jgi:hypothetical protein
VGLMKIFKKVPNSDDLRVPLKKCQERHGSGGRMG